MKAIGAEDREIKLIFFVEAAVIGLTGGVIGTLVAWGVDGLANRLAYRFITQTAGRVVYGLLFITAISFVGCDSLCALVSILAALYPAARAARMIRSKR